MNKILLLERNDYIRNSLGNILQGRFPDVVIKEVFSLDECEIAMRDFKPDILFKGSAVKNGDGLEMVHLLRVSSPATTVILFMQYDIDEYRSEAIKAGVNYVISIELWTGGEILALVETILMMKNYKDSGVAEGRSIEEDIFELPIERRRKGGRGIRREKEYLAHNPDRRRCGLIM